MQMGRTRGLKKLHGKVGFMERDVTIRCTNSSQKKESGPESNDRARRKILFVEDEAVSAVAESELLRENGYEVIIARSGEEAVDMIKADSSFDLVIMDIDLGKGLSGTEAAKKILALRPLPVVFLASHAEREMVEKARGITRYGYVLKGSGDFVLLSSIEMAFELFEAHWKTKRHIQELGDYQVEMEMQSEELERARQEAESSCGEYFDLYELAPVGYLTVDERGMIKKANITAAAMLGMEKKDLMGQGLLGFVVKDDESVYYSHLRKLIETATAQMCEIRMNRKDGSLLWVSLYAIAVQGGEEKTPSYRVAISNITKRRRAEEKLEKKAEELQRSNLELELFAYAASHDLQEPLRKITIFGDRLRVHVGPMLDERGRDYLTRMENAAQRMKKLIDGLLELSRVNTRGSSYRRVSLSKVIEDVLSDLEVHIQETGATIEAGPLPDIEADPLNMRRLFQNLISNALKFCTASPRIIIKSRPLDHLHEITIQDNGIGFDEKYLDLIFNPFHRLHARDTYEGIGMGLAICLRIVSRHHGTITAKSTPGQGSMFIITLPGRQRDAGSL
jgi:two-component system, LuxR family, sensor kinase FixL